MDSDHKFYALVGSSILIFSFVFLIYLVLSPEQLGIKNNDYKQAQKVDDSKTNNNTETIFLTLSNSSQEKKVVLGVFSAKNVPEVEKRLKKNNLSPKREDHLINGKTYIRLFFGPYKSMNKATDIKRKILSLNIVDDVYIDNY